MLGPANGRDLSLPTGQQERGWQHLDALLDAAMDDGGAGIGSKHPTSIAIGDQGHIQASSYTRPNLGRVTVDGLLTEKQNIYRILGLDRLNGPRDDVGGGQGIGDSELAVSDQNCPIDALFHTLHQGLDSLGWPHSEHGYLAAKALLQTHCHLNRVRVVGVDYGWHALADNVRPCRD